MTDANVAVPPPAQGSQGLVLRNTLLLVVAKATAMPISILLTTMMARYLGPEDFGYLYLSATFVGFGFLFVEWGQSGTLPAQVARDRSRAGEVLGSGLAWRGVSAPVVYALLAIGCHALGYPWQLQLALALQSLSIGVGGLLAACQDIVRGFERTDVAARSLVTNQFLNLLIVPPVLMLGGRLAAVLVASAVVNGIVLLLVGRALRPVGVGPLIFRRATTRTLVLDGWPFLLTGLTLALQPNIDAVFLSKLAPAEVVGWHAAAYRLLGALVFPAAALVSALYPTLCRLHAEDQRGFQETARGALRTAALVVGPVAFGTAVFADDVIRLFSRKAFGPAAENLRLYAPFVFLVYFSMPLGASLMAAGRQRAWASLQGLCVVTSLILDPVLVPWFQQRMGNGGLGVCLATVFSEVLMVTGGVWLMPRGVVNRDLARSIVVTLSAGAAMAFVARLLSTTSFWAAAPAAGLAYAAVVWVLGGVDEQQVELLKSIVRRKAAQTADGH